MNFHLFPSSHSTLSLVVKILRLSPYQLCRKYVIDHLRLRMSEQRSADSAHHEPSVCVRLINRTEFNVQVCQSNEAENNFFCEMLPAGEELTKVTHPGWTFEFVGGFGNLLYVSVNSLTASRSVQFKPTALQGELGAVKRYDEY